jgi:pyridoxal 5'-phosphate synthase pdxT subunit
MISWGPDVLFRDDQVRTVDDLDGIDAIILPGGESTAMGLIGAGMGSFKQDTDQPNLWARLKEFCQQKPVWGTCAGMILLADRCIGTSAVIQDGQSLIGGLNITVCRNYFGSQVSSFEMAVPAPPSCSADANKFPGVFIRAPAILSAGPDVEVLGSVTATPCRQAAVTLSELERKIAAGEDIVKFGVVDALEREGQLRYKVVLEDHTKQDSNATSSGRQILITLPGAAVDSSARKVICAVRKGDILCTAFHPELTTDYRWHKFFVDMVQHSLQTI